MTRATRTGCSTDQELADTAAYVPKRRCVCIHEVAALFCVKLYHLESDLKSKINSIDTYLLEEQSAKFHPDPIINDRALGFFEEIAPTRRRTTTITR